MPASRPRRFRGAKRRFGGGPPDYLLLQAGALGCGETWFEGGAPATGLIDPQK